MDHHCPWVNNCVGENNQKYFILFTFYIFVMSSIAGLAVTRKMMACNENDWEGCIEGPLDGLWIILLAMEICVFGLFTLIMFCDQMCGVMNNVDKIANLSAANNGTRRANPSKIQNLRRVFGKEVTFFSWMIPKQQRGGGGGMSHRNVVPADIMAL
jgi:palmitoyltransferase